MLNAREIINQSNVSVEFEKSSRVEFKIQQFDSAFLSIVNSFGIMLFVIESSHISSGRSVYE